MRAGRRRAAHERFGTTSRELLRRGDWLVSLGMTVAAVESTGVFRRPVWNLLEGRVELMLVNARRVKQVPGRKTDVTDCQWVAQLLEHGLLKASFVPPRPRRERGRAKHLASWAGMCPGNHESAGRRKGGRMRQANRRLKATPTRAAWGASRTRRSYCSARHRRLTTRRGVKRATVAVAQSLLVTVHCLLWRPGPHIDPRGRDASSN